MPTPIAHSLAGLAIHLSTGKPQSRIVPSFEDRASWMRIALCAFFACLADVDFLLGFLAGKNLHHHFTHSLGFTALIGICLLLVSRIFPKFFIAAPGVLTICYLSHLILDLFSKDTSPPFGMELLWPLSDGFWIAPLTLFNNIWRGTLAKLLGSHNWMAVGQEILVLMPLVLLTFWLRRPRS